MNLSEQICQCVEDTNKTMNDYDQRSAIGMARSWVDNQKPIERNDYAPQLHANRDNLAEALVTILEGHERDEQIQALRDVRQMVNAPFIDPRMMGYQASRAKKGALLSPGEKKKAKTAAAEK